jgi:hypothetical protein
MRTILLLGVAAGSLLLAGRASSAEPAPAPKLEYGTPAAPDVRVYTGSPDRVPSEVDYRQVNGTYDADGRWTGTWDGTYEAPDGRRYEGRYEGTVEGAGAGYPPPPEYDPRFGPPQGFDPRDAEMASRCGHGGQIGGAVIGGVVGGVVGNRVAGHGDRTAGTLIGGGVGALAGSAIGKEADKKKCDEWWSTRGGYHHGGYAYGYPGTTVYQQGGYAYSGYGYGYYSPGVVVVTTITTPVVTETVETTTKSYYVNAPVRKRHIVKKKWKPRPKLRCAC